MQLKRLRAVRVAAVAVVQSTFSVIILQPINGTENLLNYTFGAVTKLPAKEHKTKTKMRLKKKRRRKIRNSS